MVLPAESNGNSEDKEGGMVQVFLLKRKRKAPREKGSRKADGASETKTRRGRE